MDSMPLMGADLTDWQAAIASALDWWDEAGVRTLAEEAPRDWLARPVRPAAAQPAGQAAAPAQAEAPEDLAAFTTWRTGDAAPEAKWPGKPLFASGAMTSGVMVLADCPDRGDAEAGRLLDGTAGRLFDRMLAAIGHTREDVLLAPVMTKRPLGPLPAAAEAQLFELARRHVTLAAPRQLLLLGNAAARALTGSEALRARGSLHFVNHVSGKATAVASLHPRLLIDRPGDKAKAWTDLLLLMGAPDA
jgi:uracil-DNA glycosylase